MRRKIKKQISSVSHRPGEDAAAGSDINIHEDEMDDLNFKPSIINSEEYSISEISTTADTEDDDSTQISMYSNTKFADIYSQNSYSYEGSNSNLDKIDILDRSILRRTIKEYKPSNLLNVIPSQLSHDALLSSLISTYDHCSKIVNDVNQGRLALDVLKVFNILSYIYTTTIIIIIIIIVIIVIIMIIK